MARLLLGAVLCGAAGPTQSAVGRTLGSAAVSPVGQAENSIAFALPAGRRGLTPQLGLTYNSDGGRDVAGVGWAIYGASSDSVWVEACQRPMVRNFLVLEISTERNRVG